MIDLGFDTTNANCVDVDTAVFFPEQGANLKFRIEAAKAICSGCPVAKECLAFALKNSEMGIWGGTTDEDRKRLRRLSNPKRAINVRPTSVKALQSSNSKRTAAAATEASKILKQALETLGDKVPQATVEVANLRIKNPTLSLADIGKLVSPPITKDEAHGKLYRLMKKYKQAQ